MARPFEGAVAVVTGGASGIGKALCEELGRRGSRVAVTDLQEEGARAVAEGIVKAGGRATAAALDVQGVERNRPLIVFPFYARLLWWLSRLRPQIVVDVNRKTARAFRRRKAKS